MCPLSVEPGPNIHVQLFQFCTLPALSEREKVGKRGREWERADEEAREGNILFSMVARIAWRMSESVSQTH